MSNTIKRDDLQALSIDDILELKASEISEVTERTLFPTALYQISCTGCDVEEQNEKHFIGADFEVIQLVELENEEDAELAPEAGTSYSQRYYVGFGTEEFRTAFGDLTKVLDAGEDASIREMMEAMEGTSWEALIQKRKRTNRETKEVIEFNTINPHNCYLISGDETE